MTLYNIKPAFQSLLRPGVMHLAKLGVTANQVTIVAALGSILLGAALSYYVHISALFCLLPLWMFLRMALNAIDGMLAREFDQKSTLGAYLNELCDLISDAALFLPFAYLAPFTPTTIFAVIVLSILSEFVGLQGLSVGASRRYDGPLGKSDRALVFGALGLWFGLGGALPSWLYWLMPLLALVTTVTIYNRIKYGLAEAKQLPADNA